MRTSLMAVAALVAFSLLGHAPPSSLEGFQPRVAYPPALPEPSSKPSLTGVLPKDWSGGRGVAHGPGGKRISSKKAKKRAPVAKIYAVGHDSWEPTIGIIEDGAVFYSAFAASNIVDVMRSKDSGKTWEIVSPKIGSVNRHVSADPYVYVDPDTSRVFTIDLYVACSILSYSDDSGESWITNPIACGRPVNDHQTLFSGPPVTSPVPLYPNVLYYCWNDVLTSSCSKSLDGGITFHPTGTPAFEGIGSQDGPGTGGSLCGGIHGHGVVAHDGTVYLPRSYCGQPWVAVSSDEGKTWERFQIATSGVAEDENFGDAGGDPSVAVDRAGNVYYAWIAEDRLPYLSVSRDKGKSWSKPAMIGAPGVRETSQVSVAAGDKGRIAFSYMGSENVRPPLGAEGDYTLVTWNGYMGMSTTALKKAPHFYTAQVNKDRYPLAGRKCGQVRCNNVGDFLDVQIGPDGIPWGAFVNACVHTQCPRGKVPSGLKASGVVGRLVGGPPLIRKAGKGSR